MGALTTLLAAEAEEFNVLRIPLYEVIIALVAFLIVLLVLGKFALPKVKQILDEREEAIAGGIKKAEEAQAQVAELKEQMEAELDAARQEAAEIRTQAQADKAQIIEEARVPRHEAGRSRLCPQQVGYPDGSGREERRDTKRLRHKGRMVSTLLGRVAPVAIGRELRVQASKKA